MTLHADTPLWRPFHDEPLTCPELLLGADHLQPAQHDALARYLAAVTAARGGVLHLACAWNAVHFGYDLTTGAYHSAVLDPDYFLQITPTTEARPAIPTGALVRIERGGERAVWAEAMGKFGVCPESDTDGWIPATRSGDHSPTPLRDGTWGRSETVILDTAAFGTPSAIERKELTRLRGTGLLDPSGHLTGTAAYREPRLASLDDTAYYQHYLITQARPLLLASPLAGLLDNPHDHDVLGQAVAASFSSVRDVLTATRGVRIWGPYAVTWPPPRALPSGLLEEAVYQITRVAPRGPRYTAVRPLLHQLATGYDVADHAEGVAALAAIAQIDLTLADRATATGGNTDLRIDDPWLEGGAWRTQRLPLPAYLVGTEPLTPLGLGHRERTGTVPEPAASTTIVTDKQQPTTTLRVGNVDRRDPGTNQAMPVEQAPAPIEPVTPAPEPEPVPTAPPEQVPAPFEAPSLEREPVPTIEHLDDTLLVFNCALTRRHIDQGELPLPPKMRGELRHDKVLVELHHDGDLLEGARPQELQVADGKLIGGCWPTSFYPGIKVIVTVPRGGQRLHAATTLLDEPLVLDGNGPYAWDCDFAILRRWLGLPVGEEPREERSSTRPSPAPAAYAPAVASLQTLIIAGLRRHGTPGMFGDRSMRGPQLAAALFGPDPVPPVLLWTVIHTCEDMVTHGLLEHEQAEGEPTQFTWWPAEASPSRRTGRRPSLRQLLRDHVRAHYVPPMLRKLPAGRHASAEQCTLYAQWHREMFGADADTTLPDGYTFVRGHRRGTEQPPAWQSDLS